MPLPAIIFIGSFLIAARCRYRDRALIIFLCERHWRAAIGHYWDSQLQYAGLLWPKMGKNAEEADMRDEKETGAKPARLIAVAAILAFVMAAAPFLKGALIIGKHEGDTLHLADIVLRMADYGQLPHLDFMTPLGILSVLPIVLFVKAGFGFGMAFAAAQALVAVLLFGPILRVALTRFAGWTAWAYTGFVISMILALVHGEAISALSISMHYNRWAWALAYIALPLAMLEPRGARRPWLDGALIGLAFAIMLTVKITYAVAFFPAVVLALLLRRDFKAILAALIFGLAVMAVMTGWLGVAYWQAYLRDLLAVANSSTRSAPGLPLPDVIASPAYLGGSMALLATVIFLRQSGRMTEGLVLLLLAPAFAYVTYQNFGNDPKWLVLSGLVALSLRPANTITNSLGWPLRQALLICGVIMLALSLPSVLNMAWSPLRLLADNRPDQVPLLSRSKQGKDVLITAARMYRVVTTQPADGPGEPYAAFADRYDMSSDEKKEGGNSDSEPFKLNGEALPICEMTTGYNALFETIADDLMQQGLKGKSVLVADLFSSLWLYGDFKPVEGGAPWYYSGTPGLAHADYVLVPLCPTNDIRRNDIMKAALKAGWQFDEVARSPIYLLFKPVPPKS